MWFWQFLHSAFQHFIICYSCFGLLLCFCPDCEHILEHGLCSRVGTAPSSSPLQWGKNTQTHTHGHTHVPFALLFSMHNCRSWLCPSWEPSTEVICIGFRHGLATGGCCAQPIQGTARVWTHDGWCMRPNDHDLLCGAMKQPSTHMDTIGYHWHEQKKSCLRPSTR